MVGEYGSWASLTCYACSSFPDWSEVVDPILNVWTTFALYVVLYVLAVRRQAPGGLWTVEPTGLTRDMEQIHDGASGYENPTPMEQPPLYPGPAVPLQDVNGHRDVKQ